MRRECPPRFATLLLLPCLALGSIGATARAQAAASLTAKEPAAATRAEDAAAEQALADVVDGALAEGWGREKIVPAAPADDATWLRRLSVDLCGMIPERDDVEEFLGDSRPDKRARKIDQYLHSRAFAENLSYLWKNLLLSSAGKDGVVTEAWLRPWIEDELDKGTPFSQIVRRLLSDSDSSKEPGSTAYILSYRDSIESLASMTARAFLGLQIQCAQCHDHPYDKWKRDDFNRFAGFFLGVRADHIIGPVFRVFDMTPEEDLKDRLHRLVQTSKKMGGKGGAAMQDSMQAEMQEGDGAPAGSSAAASASPAMKGGKGGAGLDNPAMAELMRMCKRSGKGESPLKEIEDDPKRVEDLLNRLPADARDLIQKYRERKELFGNPGFLDGKPYAPSEKASKRAALADWILSPDNPWFAKAIANRMWDHLFGKGPIEPVDDLSGSKDQVLPELLDPLSQAFLQHGTDLRFLIGALARTRAYALGNSTTADEDARQHEERWFAAHPLRPFTAEQVLHSLIRVTAVGEERHSRGRNGALELEQKRMLDHFKTFFSDDEGGGADSFSASIPQALFLMNGNYTNETGRVRQTPLLQAVADRRRSVDERLRQVFYAALARGPSATETAKLGPFLASGAAPESELPEDVFWALLNSTEFHTNH